MTTWVILPCARKPEQSHTRYLTILCMSAEGFSGLLADSKHSLKLIWGSALTNSRIKFCDFAKCNLLHGWLCKTSCCKKLECFADIIPGEFKEGYMDVFGCDSSVKT